MAATKFFDPETIEIVDEVFGQEEKKFNPRTVLNKGFTPERMEELAEGIRKDGLNNPILIRIETKDNSKKLIAGERRLRVIKMLISRDKSALERISNGEKDVERYLVKNPKNGKIEPAIDVYKIGGVECRISDATDEKEWVRQAIQENTLHEPLSEYELLQQCELMESHGLSRSEQASIMGTSEAWISQSHALLSGEKSHPKILELMECGKLPRTAALTFLDIPTSKQISTLEKAINLNYAAAKDKLIEAQNELNQASCEMEAGEAQLRYHTFSGDFVSKNKANKQIQRAHRKKDAAQKKIDQINKKADHISVESVLKAASQVNGAGKDIKKPQTMKMVKQKADYILKLIEDNPDNNILSVGNGEEIDKRDVELVHGVLKWVLNRQHCNCPLDIISLINNND